MITVTKATSINEEEFSELFHENYYFLIENNGEPFWRLEKMLEREATYHERKDYFLELFTDVMNNDLESDFIMEVRNDDTLVFLGLLQNGIHYGQSEDILRLGTSMGRAINGSKLWYWGDEYCIERLNFLDSIDADGFVEIHLHSETDIMKLTRTQISKVEKHMDVEIYEDPYTIPEWSDEETLSLLAKLPTPTKVKYTKKNEE